MDHPHLQKVLLENRPFRVGHYISKGFEIFGKNLGSFVAFSLLSVLIMSFVGSVPWVGAWASKFAMVPVLTAGIYLVCLLYTSPSPRDRTRSRMPSSA